MDFKNTLKNANYTNKEIELNNTVNKITGTENKKANIIALNNTLLLGATNLDKNTLNAILLKDYIYNNKIETNINELDYLIYQINTINENAEENVKNNLIDNMVDFTVEYIGSNHELRYNLAIIYSKNLNNNRLNKDNLANLLNNDIIGERLNKIISKNLNIISNKNYKKSSNR